MKDYPLGESFVWPAFTSMSTDPDVCHSFGNITFEVRVQPPDGLYEDEIAEYVPAPVQEWSVFPSEAEILFAPNIQFMVKEIQMPGEHGRSKPHIICDTIAFDTDEGLAELASFKARMAEIDGADTTLPEQRASVFRTGLRQIFAVADRDDSGCISVEEARGAFKKVRNAALVSATELPSFDPNFAMAFVNKMFKNIDVDKNGCIVYKELLAYFEKQVVSTMGKSLEERFLEMPQDDWMKFKRFGDALLQAFEYDFIKYRMKKHNVDQKHQDKILAMFQNADVNCDGVLSEAELSQIMLECGMEEGQVKEIFNIVDANRNGVVAFSEFISWLFSGGGKKDAGGKKALAKAKAMKNTDADFSSTVDRIALNNFMDQMKVIIVNSGEEFGEGDTALEVVFHKIDSNKSGKLSLQEFKLGAEALGFYDDSSVLQAIFKCIDVANQQQNFTEAEIEEVTAVATAAGVDVPAFEWSDDAGHPAPGSMDHFFKRDGKWVYVANKFHKPDQQISLNEFQKAYHAMTS